MSEIDHLEDELSKARYLLRRSQSDDVLLAESYFIYKQLSYVLVKVNWKVLKKVWETKEQCFYGSFVEDFFIKDFDPESSLSVEQTAAIFKIDKGLKDYCAKKVAGYDIFGEIAYANQNADYRVVKEALTAM